MSNKNPWADVLSLGEQWFLKLPITTATPGEKCLGVFTTLGAADLYVKNNNIPNVRPKAVANPKQMYGLCVGAESSGYTHILIDPGTDRARIAPVGQIIDALRAALGL